MSTKRIEVRFYETSLGNEPVREWLKALSPEDRHRIGTDIKMVEYGWPIGMPTCRPMGHGLCVRTYTSTTLATLDSAARALGKRLELSLVDD